MEHSHSRRLPVTDDVDTGGFWSGAAEGELRIRACDRCGAFVHLPRAYCPQCHAAETRWRAVVGRGRLYAYCVVEQQIDVSFPTPYTTVLVELDDARGVRLLGHLSGRRTDLSIGMPMVVDFMRIDSEVVLPQWRPVVRNEDVRV